MKLTRKRKNKIKEELTRHGLTFKEQEISDKLVDIWNLFLKLPQTHPDEITELRFAVHIIQGLLTARIARREYPEGWPIYREK